MYMTISHDICFYDKKIIFTKILNCHSFYFIQGLFAIHLKSDIKLLSLYMFGLEKKVEGKKVIRER